MEATVLNNVTRDMTVAREEIFGPVLSILEYQDTEEAISIANDTDYGLGGGVFTKDLNKAAWTANKLQSGQVYVNKWFTGSHATPFGGYKQSGYSREKGVEALKVIKVSTLAASKIFIFAQMVIKKAIGTIQNPLTFSHSKSSGYGALVYPFQCL